MTVENTLKKLYYSPVFGMNQKMIESLLKSQIKNIKRLKVEIEGESETKTCEIIDHKIQQGLASLHLQDQKTGENFKLHFRL